MHLHLVASGVEGEAERRHGSAAGSQGEVVPTLQSIDAKPQMQRSKVMQLPKVTAPTPFA